MTVVKVGDRVRLTLEDSVIVGVCHKGTNYSPSLWVTPDGTDVTFIYNTSWTVEVLAPPIPDVVGTIVRDGDGDAWQRFEDGWYSTATVARSDPLALPKLQRQYGPLTVLWTPEATP